jgi:hypothetical protein
VRLKYSDKREEKMKNRLFSTSLVGLLASLVLIAGFFAISGGREVRGESTQSSADEFSKRSIAGVWLVEAQRRNCQTGAPIGPAGRGLVTFAADGTLSETTAPPAAAEPLEVPVFRSPGHGVWQRLNWEHYTGAFISQRLNSDGTFAGWTRSKATYQLMESGSEITSTVTVELLDPSGNVFLAGCATATGTRFE